MIVGIPKEIKNQEYRLGMIPSQVHTLVKQGHQVLVEKGAGEGVGLQDTDYQLAGARIVEMEEVFAQAELVIKVKEPQATEIARLHAQQVLFT